MAAGALPVALSRRHSVISALAGNDRQPARPVRTMLVTNGPDDVHAESNDKITAAAVKLRPRFLNLWYILQLSGERRSQTKEQARPPQSIYRCALVLKRRLPENPPLIVLRAPPLLPWPQASE